MKRTMSVRIRVTFSRVVVLAAALLTYSGGCSSSGGGIGRHWWRTRGFGEAGGNGTGGGAGGAAGQFSTDGSSTVAVLATRPAAEERRLALVDPQAAPVEPRLVPVEWRLAPAAPSPAAVSAARLGPVVALPAQTAGLMPWRQTLLVLGRTPLRVASLAVVATSPPMPSRTPCRTPLWVLLRMSCKAPTRRRAILDRLQPSSEIVRARPIACWCSTTALASCVIGPQQPLSRTSAAILMPASLGLSDPR